MTKSSTHSRSSTHPEPPTGRHERLQWAELLRRTYAIDVLVCKDCGARRERIALLTAPDSIRRILEHLGLPTRPPPIRFAPAALFELDGAPRRIGTRSSNSALALRRAPKVCLAGCTGAEYGFR